MVRAGKLGEEEGGWLSWVPFSSIMFHHEFEPNEIRPKAIAQTISVSK